MNIVKLYNIDVGVNEEFPIVRSQTLFSAILNALPSKAEELLQNKDFTVSSMFPFSGNKIYLPILNAMLLFKMKKETDETDQCEEDNESSRSLEKQLKKKKIVPLEAFKGKVATTDLIKDKPDEIILLKNAHNSVSRKTIGAGDTKLFFSFRLKSNENSGLWFAYPQEFKKVIKEALDEIKYFGFGRDKSTSAQPFDKFEFLEIEDDGDLFINLGLYSPTKDEIEQFIKKSHANEELAPKYELVKYAGWTETLSGCKAINREKPAKYYFKEGSVFPYLGKSLYGERKPYEELEGDFEHKIYWNGITPIFRFSRGDFL